MDNLQTALGLLESKLGKFDNVKLLLGGGESMSITAVRDAFLTIATQVVEGEIIPGNVPCEASFQAVHISA